MIAAVEKTITTCRDNDVATGVYGRAAAKPQMVGYLIDADISSVSVNVDAVADHGAKHAGSNSNCW